MNFRGKAILFFATGCWIGNIPLAPGTFGSLVGLGICFVLAQFKMWTTVALTITLVGLAVWIAHEAEKVLAQKDP